MNKIETKKFIALADSMGEDGVVLLAAMARIDHTFMSTKEFVDLIVKHQELIRETTEKLNTMDEFHKKNWIDAVWARAHSQAAQSLLDIFSLKDIELPLPLNEKGLKLAQDKSHPGSVLHSYTNLLVWLSTHKMHELVRVATIERKHQGLVHLWFMHDGKPICRYGVGEKDYE